MEQRPARRYGIAKEAREAASFIWNHPANHGRRGRKLAEAAMFQMRGRLLNKPTVARIGTHSKVSLLPGHGQAGLLYANPVDWPEIQCWRRTLRGGLFLDVGANIGCYTIWALELGCEVIAVEPDDWARTQLTNNLALNGYSATVVAAAVSDHEGSVGFTSGLGVLNHITAEEQGAKVVPATTLDRLIGARTVAGLKIDVEGAEASVLRGGTKALNEQRIALIQLEWNPTSTMHFGAARTDVAALLTEAGYEICRPDHDGVLHPVEHLAPGPDVFARPVAPARTG